TGAGSSSSSEARHDPLLGSASAPAERLGAETAVVGLRRLADALAAAGAQRLAGVTQVAPRGVPREDGGPGRAQQVRERQQRPQQGGEHGPPVLAQVAVAVAVVLDDA